MRTVLEALADGELTVAEAEARLRGYVPTEAGRYDASRPARRGMPEAILATGKTPEEVIDLADVAIETTGVALVTRADEATIDRLRDMVSSTYPDATVTVDERAGLVIARTDPPPALDATVLVVSGGTADTAVAREAAATAAAMGATVDRVEDVGVASIDRVLDHRTTLDDADVVVAVAGREGSLPTVVAGMTTSPVIAVPVDSGYGYGGDGEAALMSALQSCTVLTTVNIDAGYVAGAQAGLIARAIHTKSTDGE